MVHSLDRMSLAKEIDRQGTAKGKRMPVLVQVNVAKEPQKAGLDVTQVQDFIATVKEFKGLQIEGLMAMMPQCENEQLLKTYFRQMKELFTQLKEKNIPHIHMNHLSMGMSQDYHIAAQEGATLVRIGSAIFK